MSTQTTADLRIKIASSLPDVGSTYDEWFQNEDQWLKQNLHKNDVVIAPLPFPVNSEIRGASAFVVVLDHARFKQRHVDYLDSSLHFDPNMGFDKGVVYTIIPWILSDPDLTGLLATYHRVRLIFFSVTTPEKVSEFIKEHLEFALLAN
ncbi:hypothetical protein A2801_00745 [Candidatus Woesebacteria bacterium RIFCSPHIGHO2_01_FULL_41_10]|uniref:Uncharacterized protein n=1 Tax=Candidatus Woesebacteria bacterium RIFCSPHIGHO2_01_FULL_41_10 TaxID=1802500 RepID=A0A1F7YP09_9BACT|nr:MAG: hypothetical protein A2801_00745 [Candidatus Woesebacteria bacterium RIFCSPHIGHO2_01_FULL_41_10]